MAAIAIRCEGLGKQYRIGRREPYKTLSGVLTDTLYVPFRRIRDAFRSSGESSENNQSRIWALKDVGFEVNRGEVLGIIGRNGAGKTTLLKILSRITEPTEGRAEVNGRVGSLLEVGTGFHPELNGRENIYLNGAILGMKKKEIDEKFDEIVDFAEVEKFIDTPAKRYSTGMQARLAFAVAAHLEPEILLVDEVLAVGDAEFQKKSLGKMKNVAREGRTVLLVSHNMQAIRSLCGRVIELDKGGLAYTGDAHSAVSHYLSGSGSIGSEVSWPEDEAPGTKELKLLAVRVGSSGGHNVGFFSSSDELMVEILFKTNTTHPALCIGFDLMTDDGTLLLRSFHTDSASENTPPIRPGPNLFRCTLPRGQLNAGTFMLCPRIGLHNMYWILHMDAVIRFEMILGHGLSPFWNSLDARQRPGIIAPILKWESLDHGSVNDSAETLKPRPAE